MFENDFFLRFITHFFLYTSNNALLQEIKIQHKENAEQYGLNIYQKLSQKILFIQLP